jgi:class 3 adenylate cyclase
VRVACGACGAQSPDGFRFCGACGAPLEAPEPEREQRKVLTIVFCDVAGSTALGERLDPEALRRVMRRYFDEMTAVVERHGGTVEKFIGDAVVAVFGIPHVREDDALRAVRAASEIRERLPAVAAELGVELSFRTGVNTGEVVVGAGQTLATGDAMNVAARLEQAAAPGEILIGADTRRLVRDAVLVDAVEPLELKGKAEPVAAWRLLEVDPAADALARRLDAPLVGRERELAHLRGAYER